MVSDLVDPSYALLESVIIHDLALNDSRVDNYAAVGHFFNTISEF